MRRWTWILVLAMSLLAPAHHLRADEDPPAKSNKSKAGTRGTDKEKKDQSTEDRDSDSGRSDEKSKSDKASPIKRLIEVTLDPYLIPARQLNIPLPGRTQELRELLTRFDKWAKDDEVGAVLMNLNGVNLAIPDIEELRGGVAEFRKSGKKVVAYLNSGDPMGYLLACEADEIAMAPTGELTIPGMGRLFPFMRGMFQLQGIEYDVITAGRFKYPGFFNQREPNKYFREEFGQILDGWYEDYVDMIAVGRRLEPRKVREAIDVALFDAQAARSRGLVDVIAYYDEYRDRVLRRSKFAKSRDEGTDFSKVTSLQDLLTLISKQIREAQEGYKAVGPKIAVLNARGPIIDDDMGPAFASSVVMRDQFVKSIEEIRKNKTIRAVVLRIDSPGGSGYASDVIWRKLRELDEEKPVVVSMGSVAGSGGYYIACPGRLIYAEPTTITGSIGVLAILMNRASMFNRMDVNLAEMKRGARALLGVGHRDMVPEDREFIQKVLLDFYEIFLDRVSTTRRMPKDEVRKIAEGRIYTGRQAQKIGLVDRLGGLKDAVAAARDLANIPPSAEIKLVHYPRPSSIGELVENALGMSMAMQTLTNAQMPAPAVPFEGQLKYFSQLPRPLCWMGLPDLVSNPSFQVRQQMPAELFGVPTQPNMTSPGR